MTRTGNILRHRFSQENNVFCKKDVDKIDEIGILTPPPPNFLKICGQLLRYFTKISPQRISTAMDGGGSKQNRDLRNANLAGKKCIWMYIFYRASALFSANSLYLNRLFSKKLSGAIFKKDYYKGQTAQLFYIGMSGLRPVNPEKNKIPQSLEFYSFLGQNPKKRVGKPAGVFRGTAPKQREEKGGGHRGRGTTNGVSR